MVEAGCGSQLKLLPLIILDIFKVLSTLICCPWAHSSSLVTQSHPPYLAQSLRFWVTFGVQMMSLCHGWGWQTPQTPSNNHIRHSQSVCAHLNAIHGHTVAALHSYSYIHPTWLRVWGSGSHGESKWSHNIMVWGWQTPETASCIRIRHIYKCLSTLICCP
jgi:hypothetical protein